MTREKGIEKDVDAILQLAGIEPPALCDLGSRRQRLLAALGAGTDADVWLWTLQQMAATTFDVAFLGLIEKGWSQPSQRVGWLDGTFSTAFQDLLGPVRDRLGEHQTFTRSDLVPDDAWYQSEFYKSFRAPYGLDDFLLSFRPIGSNLQSAVRLHRLQHRPAFDDRERELVHEVTRRCDWLHQVPLPEGNFPSTSGLTPRQRQVLVFLLKGGSVKEIAEDLNLSVHTVNDHMRDLHSHFGAQSRSEIMARFISPALLV